MTNGDILNLQIRCALFKKKLNGNQLANHILESIEVRLQLDMTMCRAIMCDRAATNKNALRELEERYGDIRNSIDQRLSILRVYCISHTLSNAGKQIYSKEVTPFIDSFIKIWQKVIQYPGNAGDLARENIHKAIKEAGGVRFYTHYE